MVDGSRPIQNTSVMIAVLILFWFDLEGQVTIKGIDRVFDATSCSNLSARATNGPGHDHGHAELHCHEIVGLAVGHSLPLMPCWGAGLRRV